MFAPPQLSDCPFQDPIRLADWVELNLLMEEEWVVSVTGLADELARIPPDNSRDSESSSKYREVAEEKAEAAFIELSKRSGWLKNHYPIEVDGDAALLQEQMAAQEVYQFLVLLRARQLYQRALEDDGSESGLLFEELVRHALGAYVGARPEHQVRFGVAGGFRGDGLPQPLAEAVQELSRRMFEKPGLVSSGGRGDFKADAVAWKPFGDERPGQLVMIGQATISEGHWKREEPPNRWTDREPPDTRLIRFRARPLTAVAFPETLSLTSPDVLDGMTFSSVPFDRLRLLSVLNDEDLPSDLRNSMRVWGRELKARLPQ